MTKFPHSAWKLSTACTLGAFVGKESHFKIYAYAPVKPGNYETPPTEQPDQPSQRLKHSTSTGDEMVCVASASAGSTAHTGVHWGQGSSMDGCSLPSFCVA